MLIVVAVLAALVAEFWWVLVLAGIVTVTFVLIRRSFRNAVRYGEVRNEFARRADQQHAQVLAGDDRGIYGKYPPAI